MDLAAVLFGVFLIALLSGLLAVASRRRRRSGRAIDALRALTPVAFERQVGAWLARGGWIVDHTGGPGDGGIDLMAFAGGTVLAVQCKRYAEHARVSAPQVRDLYGAAVAAGATRAAIVTTGRLTASARAWVDGLPPTGPAVAVFEGDILAGMARSRSWPVPRP